MNSCTTRARIVAAAAGVVGVCWSAPARPVAQGDGASSAQGEPLATKARPIVGIDALLETPVDAAIDRREIAVEEVLVVRVAAHGFWIAAEGARGNIFVMPAEGNLITVRAGERVSLVGEARLLHLQPLDRRQTSEPARTTFFIYAYTVRPAWPAAHVVG
jgi:hypothetical protein